MIPALNEIELKIVKIARQNPSKRTKEDVTNWEKRITSDLGKRLLDGKYPICTEDQYSAQVYLLDEEFKEFDGLGATDEKALLDLEYKSYLETLRKLTILRNERDEWIKIKKEILEKTA
jgi:hypothetical protein